MPDQATDRDPMIFPIKGMTLEPDGMPLMLSAYLGLVQWLIGQEWAREQFKQDTGHDLMRVLGARGIESMVDKATGHDVAVVGAWADWVTRTQWGEAIRKD